MRRQSTSSRILLTVLLSANLGFGQPVGGGSDQGSSASREGRAPVEQGRTVSADRGREPGITRIANTTGQAVLSGSEPDEAIRISSRGSGASASARAGEEVVESKGLWRAKAALLDAGVPSSVSLEQTGQDLAEQTGVGPMVSDINGAFTATLPDVEDGGSSDARYALEQDWDQLQAEIEAQGNDTPSRQLVDIEMRWTGSEFMYSSIYYPVTGDIHARFDVDTATFTAWALEKNDLDGRWLDLEVEEIGGQLTYSAIFYEDGDEYDGTLLINADETNLENAMFSDLDQGMTIVDFESWEDSNGDTRYAIVTVNDPNQPRTHLYRNLEWSDISGANANSLMNPLHGRIIDVERYRDPWDRIRYAMVVAMHRGGDWAVSRHQTVGDLATNNGTVSDDDTHLIDIEAYDNGGEIQFAGIWGDAWKSLNEIDALPPANIIPLGTDLTSIVNNFENTPSVSGRIGIFARSVRGDESIGYRENEPFYLASTTKIAVHARLWQLYESTHLDPNDTVLYGDPADPFYNGAFADSAVPWYVDERPNPGLSTLTVGNFTSDAGQAIPLRILDRAMMRVSDNSATSMLVKDPTIGLAWDGLDLNEWLSNLSGVGQGWGVVTAINDLDTVIAWQGQFTDTTKDQISVFRAPRAGFETWNRGDYGRCTTGGARCNNNNGCSGSLNTCNSVIDPWGDLAAFFLAEGAASGTPPSTTPEENFERYYNMGLNHATPRALGMLQEKLVNGIYDPPNGLLNNANTIAALNIMTAFSGLRRNSTPSTYSTGTVILPTHFQSNMTFAKGGIKGGVSTPCSDSAIYRFGPDAIVLNVLTENNDRSCSGNPGDVRDTLYFQPPNGLRTLAAAVLQQLTADLVTGDLGAALFGPSQVWAGKSFTVFNEVENVGNIDSPAFDVTFVVSTNENITLTDPVIGTYRVPGIPAGGSAPAIFTGVFPSASSVPGGDYNVGWVIDSTSILGSIGEVGEWDETAASNSGFLPGLSLNVVDPPPPPCPDADADGYAECNPGYLCDLDNVTCGDCDDDNFARNPGATEICDGMDNNCNDIVDDGFSRLWSAEVLQEEDPDGDEFMGAAIASVGDVNGDMVDDFIVGTYADDTIASAAGSVTLYSGIDRSLICVATDPGGASNDWLGYSVADVGDVTGAGGSPPDGIPDFVAGVRNDDDMGTNSGSVVLFSGLDCSFVRKMVDPNGAANDHLGESVVGLYNTGTGDFVPDIAAGAPDNDQVAFNAGKVVVFSGALGTVISELVDAPGGSSSDGLGTSLAAFGKYNGGIDGTIIAGAPDFDSVGSDTGVLVKFDGLNNVLLDRYIGPVIENSQKMGASVAVLPDITGDGIPEIATGAIGGDTMAGAGRGKVYVLSGADGTALRVVADPGGGSGDKFGASVSAVSRVPGASGDEIGIVVGAFDKNTGAGTDAGSLFVFGAETGDLLASLQDPDGEALDELGFSVVGLGDLNGDGYSELAAGAPKAHGFEARDAGKVLVYSLQSDCDGDGFTSWAGDCSESFSNVGPGFAEVCDGQDNDCDGFIDEDSDGDGFAVCDAGECDDSDPLIYAGTIERCNGLDDNCNNLVDEGVDLDGDGWKEPCDCDDSEFDINPGASDLVCDSIDQNCNGIPDDVAPKSSDGLVVQEPDGRTDDELATSLAAIGDVNGDGIPDLAAGVPKYDLPGVSAGRVVIFSGATNQVHCFLEDPDGVGSDELGDSVASLGDVNGDLVPDIVVGAPGYSQPQNDAGAVLVFSGADCTRLYKSTNVSGETNDSLGMTVAGLGDLNGDGKPEYAGGAPDADPNGVLGAGLVIVFNGATGQEMYRLTNTQKRQSDNFGSAIARIGDVDADGIDDIVIAANLDDTSQTGNVGTISIHSGVDGAFLYKVKDVLGSNGDELGSAVVGLTDVDGDNVPDFAGGAPFDDDGGSNNGAILVFSGKTGTLIRKITESATGDVQELGTSLALLPDINGDGVDDLAAGAPGDDNSGPNDGSILLLSGADGSLLQYFVKPGLATGQKLGKSLAVVGDVTGDGVPEIAGGAPARSGPEDTNVGAAIIFTIESDCDGDGEGSYLGDCDDNEPLIFVGASEVCDTLDNDCDGQVDEDEDGDGYDACTDCDNINPQVHPGATELCNGIDDNCVGGADEAGPDLDGDGFSGPCADCDETSSLINTGEAETCNTVDDNCDGQVDEGFSMPLTTRLILDPEASLGDHLGERLAAVGDVDQDGFQDFAVGMADDDPSGSARGSVLVFSGSSLAPICRMTDPDGSNADMLGTSVAGGFDLTGDGVPDVIAGAVNEDTQDTNAGAVLLFSGADCSLVRKMVDPDGGNADHLGWSVAIIEDVTGDGIADIASGAENDTVDPHGSTGSVVIFSGADGSHVRKILDPHPRSSDVFGHAVVGLGDVDGDNVGDIAVGAYLDNNLNGINAGSVELFSGADGSHLRSLRIAGGGGTDHLGYSVDRIADLDGDGIDDVIAGAPNVDDPGTNAGVVVAFSSRTGSEIRTYVDLLATNNTDMGTSVVAVDDVDGDGIMEVLAGSPKGDTTGTSTGEAILFSGATGAVLHRFLDPFAAGGDMFGTAVLCLPDVTGGGYPEIVVGSPFADTMAGTSAGVLTIFSLEADCDGDGITPLLDCDDTDPGQQGLPGAAEDVLFSDDTTMSWSPPAGAGGDPNALAYDVIRSQAAGDFMTAAVCTETDDGGDTMATVSDVPAVDSVHYFLVRTQNRCGNATAGVTSEAIERSVRPCP